MSNKVGGVDISNADRVVFPAEKITKLEVVKYYSDVSKFILPFLNERPISVIRCHKIF